MSIGSDVRAPGRARAGRWLLALLWGMVAVLGVAIVTVVLVKTWPLLHPVVNERAPLSPDCDLLTQACSVWFATGAEVELDIQPRGIPAVHPLALRVSLKGLPTPERVEVDFAGVEMAMGFNRADLSWDLESAAWTGKGMLPVCVRDRMTWEARVLLHYPDRLLAAPFRFVSLRPGEH
ncbi:MAG: hypothetical protein VBE63_15165 [Lamprobacter sp.]|uniref:hypothetical protein n=1 Tax=Lamprobacter sp. TaxID=3100796 RepID=UPI002B259C57|nr:hypothetical protein [Lamprobacter sp.]MEA3641263.1 hypothetical protein [Lamprobacter sp.]